MMRWLKDKKKGDKKSFPQGGAVGGAGGYHDEFDKDEDDYGFEKEKVPPPNKSPAVKRQLPPTPAVPEEKSIHIYEEIPDILVSSVSDHERSSATTVPTTNVKSKKHGRSKSPLKNKSNNNNSSSQQQHHHHHSHKPRSSNNSSSHKKHGDNCAGDAGAKSSTALEDSISPYMVVPVDDEVRQTPPHFHRNGTPEMHCDLIVKDTHCEVFLTQKPKVGAFRIDGAAPTITKTGAGENIAGGGGANGGVGGGGGGAVSSGIRRNNTHFCSWNRRASVDVQSAGGGAGGGRGVGENGDGLSHFSWSNSAFSSASSSKVNMMGNSAASLSTLPEHHLHHGKGHGPGQIQAEGDGGGSNGSSVQGVMTYSTGGNFIPRSTKLVFKPLTPLDPDFFDDPDQDVALRAAERALNGQQQHSSMTISNACAAQGASDDSIQYSSVQGQMKPALSATSDSPVEYSAIQNNDVYSEGGGDAELISLSQNTSATAIPPSSSSHDNYAPCQPASPPNLHEIRASSSILSDNPFRLTIIRPYSPSSSSSCTYASVNLPSESRVYNTIHDLDLLDAPHTSHHVTSLSSQAAPMNRGDGDGGVAFGPGTYGGDFSNGSFFPSRNVFANCNVGNHNGASDFSDGSIVYPGSLPNHVDSSSHNNNNRQRSNLLRLQYVEEDNHQRSSEHAVNRNGRPSDGAIYSGSVAPSESSIDTTYARIDSPGEGVGLPAMTSNILRNKMETTGGLDLEFCTCRDYQQYSSCGCSSLKADDDDDDDASVVTTTNEPKGSCSGCGRLIRQITYSESYSDETYEHAYSSRLLLRRGRRFSSPDITLSEISHSESQDLQFRQGSPFGTMARDDMWPRSHMTTCDDMSIWPRSHTFYKPDVDGDSASSAHLQLQQERSFQQHPPSIQGHSVGSEIAEDRTAIPKSLPQHHRLQRKSFCAFSNMDMTIAPNSGSGNGLRPHHMKRTSLPLSSDSNQPTRLVPATSADVKPGRSSALAQLQPKSSAFSGLFSKFSRPKVKAKNATDDGIESPSGKTGSNVLSSPQTAPKVTHKPQELTSEVPPTIKSTAAPTPIPEKNTLKLSKIFQRLSTKEMVTEPTNQVPRKWDWKSEASLCVDLGETSLKPPQSDTHLSSDQTVPKTIGQKSHILGELSSLENNQTTLTNKNIVTINNNSNKNNNNNNNLINNGNNSTNSFNKSGGNVTKNSVFSSNTDIASKKSGHHYTDGIGNQDAKLPLFHKQQKFDSTVQQTLKVHSLDTTVEQVAACFSPVQETPVAVGQSVTNKTDSGDTCYEYDISTSSESEHTNYDDFLSKVKKSLNLEKEVQHIADMNALRRKLLCKMCKKGSSSSFDPCGESFCGESQGPSSSSSSSCAHSSVLKCSDWRKFFGEMVVDQRAAILDCLTDFAHSPYTVKGDEGNHSNHCRECGGEIMTSDSESLTTVYSLLSQHLQLTASPSAHTPSCDSDEGTMADNSCESGDDEKVDDGVGEDSSGFDDDDVTGKSFPQSSDHHQRTKKKEKTTKEKRDSKRGHSNFHLDRMRRGSQVSLSHDHVGGNIYPKGGNGDDVSATIYKSANIRQSALDCGDKAHFSSTKRHSTVGLANKPTGGRGHQPSSESQPRTLVARSSSVDSVMASPKHDNNHNTNYNHQTTAKDIGCEYGVGGRAKTCLLATDKAIQDIYAPLPSKALSWMTARHGHAMARCSNPCACTRVSPAGSNASLQNSTMTEQKVLAPLVVTSETCDKDQDMAGSGEKVAEISSVISSAHDDTLVDQTKKSHEDQSVKSHVLKSLTPAEMTIKEKTALHPQKSSIENSRSLSAGGKGNSSPPNQNQNSGESKSQSQDPIPSPKLNFGRRRSRQLSLATLDLLPETAFGSDVTEDANTQDDDKGQSISISSSENNDNGSRNIKDNKHKNNDCKTNLFTDIKNQIIDNKTNDKRTNDNESQNIDNKSNDKRTNDNESQSTDNKAGGKKTIDSKSKPPRPRLVQRMARLFEGNSSSSAKDVESLARSSSQSHPPAVNVTTRTGPLDQATKHPALTVAAPEMEIGIKKANNPNESGHKQTSGMQIRRHVDQADEYEKETTYHASPMTILAPLHNSRSTSLSDTLVSKPRPPLSDSIKFNDRMTVVNQCIPTDEKSSPFLEAASKGDDSYSAGNLERNIGAGKPSDSCYGTERKTSKTRDLHIKGLATPPSPSLSTSSSSSSSSFSRRRASGGGHTKQRRMTKKSQTSTKKVKSKVTERKKKKKKDGAKEEKTYYCLSSDMSDIDTIEVEDYDIYSTQQSPSKTSDTRRRSRSQSSSGRGSHHHHHRHHHHHHHHNDDKPNATSISNRHGNNDTPQQMSKDNQKPHRRERRERSASQNPDVLRRERRDRSASNNRDTPRRERTERSASRGRELSSSSSKRKHRIESDAGGIKSIYSTIDQEATPKEKEYNMSAEKRVYETGRDDDAEVDDEDEENHLVQEVYSMPPNSSEVCEVKGHRDDKASASSPCASPEMQKLRKKSKRTDIYKSKKGNNRLLSDLIISNYDRQVFGNV